MILSASFDLNDPEMWENRGLFYGDGIFETMRSSGSSIPLWQLHYERLHNSLQWLHIQSPPEASLYQTLIQSLTEQDWLLRLTLFRQQEQRGYQPTDSRCHWLLTGSEFKPNNHAQHLIISQQPIAPQPMLNGHKHLNRLPQVLLAEQLNKQPQADDILVLDTQKRVIETSCQNIVIIHNGRLITPDLRDCGVAGITLNWLAERMPVETETVALDDIKLADALMTCNAVHGFRYVQHISGLGDFNTNNPIGDKIAGMWRQQFLQSNLS